MELNEKQRQQCESSRWDFRDNGGIPAHGNQRSEWDAGCRFDYPNSDYR